MAKTNITGLAVKTGARAIAIVPGLIIAGIKDPKTLVFASLLASIGVSIFQIGAKFVLGSIKNVSDDED